MGADRGDRGQPLHRTARGVRRRRIGPRRGRPRARRATCAASTSCATRSRTCVRAVERGIRGFLIADTGLMRGPRRRWSSRGELPASIVFKASAVLAPSNPVSFRQLADLGATTINVPSDVTLVELAEMRALAPTPIDLYLEAPDALGGMVRGHELAEIVLVAAPLYAKYGLRNARAVYPAGAPGHGRRGRRTCARRSAAPRSRCEWLERSGADLIDLQARRRGHRGPRRDDPAIDTRGSAAATKWPSTRASRWPWAGTRSRAGHAGHRTRQLRRAISTRATSRSRDLVAPLREGVEAAGGVAVEFPVMSLGEDLMKPAAMLYRNLVAMEVEESLRSQPLDGVVVLAACDKSVPGAPDGRLQHEPADAPRGRRDRARSAHFHGRRIGTGTDLWRVWDDRRAGRLSRRGVGELRDRADPRARARATRWARRRRWASCARRSASRGPGRRRFPPATPATRRRRARRR